MWRHKSFAAFWLLASVGIGVAVHAQDADVGATARSPDGLISAVLSDERGKPTYSVSFDGDVIIDTSALGIRFKHGQDLTDGFEISQVETYSNDEVWEQPWGEARMMHDHFNGFRATLSSSNEPELEFLIDFRVYDEGVAFRYNVPDYGERVIVDEITEFTIDPNSTAWWTPAGEFNRYEYIYKTTELRDVSRAHTPFTLRTPDGVHVAIHEAALVKYGGAWLDQRRAGKLEIEIAPRYDGSKVHVDGEFVTPWRVIQIGREAVDLINGSGIYLNLNEPNVLGDVSYVQPGVYAGVWWGMHINRYTWGSGPNHGASNEIVRDYIDFAADNGMVGVLVEGWNTGWDGDWFNNGEIISFTESYPDFDLPALAAYAQSRGTNLIGHHETSGAISNYENQMEEAFALYAANGITAVKTGYVADGSDLLYRDEDGHPRFTWHDSQESVDHHIRVLKAAHRHGIAVNAHEPVHDTGLRRTYPNAISREGARGQEFNAWGSPPNPPEHQAILPFTRMLAGPFDFTPGIFDLMPNGADSENRVPTTLAKQLALYVTIYSPIQMAADLPENYARYPEAFQFIRDVATDWETSLALQGEVGDFIVMARKERGSEEWFLGAVTDEEARALSVPLAFLSPGQSYRAEIYRDGENADWETNPYDMIIEVLTVDQTTVLELPLATSGGAAVRFIPE
jgi:alpha-glucosidase